MSVSNNFQRYPKTSPSRRPIDVRSANEIKSSSAKIIRVALSKPSQQLAGPSPTLDLNR